MERFILTEFNLQSLVLGLLSLVVSVAIPIVGFVVNRIFKSIDDLRADVKENLQAAKADAKTLVVDEERRRDAAIGGVMTQVNAQYVDLKGEMHNIRTDIKELRDAG